jgi:hypothetical protein
VRSDFVVTGASRTIRSPITDPRSCAVVDPESPDNVLTVHGSVDEHGGSFRAPSGPSRASRAPARGPIRRVYMASSSGGKIYEVVYTAQNPPLVRLGPAAVVTSSRC